MPALNFQRKFVPMIVDGTKKQTIRKERKNRVKPGDTLYLYAGMRTAKCMLIREAICSEIEQISIELMVDKKLLPFWAIDVNNRRLRPDERNALAIADGFADIYEFVQFFHTQYGPGGFVGIIIRWA